MDGVENRHTTPARGNLYAVLVDRECARPPAQRRSSQHHKVIKMTIMQSGAVAPVPFSFESHAVRAVNRNGECWFVAMDVCNILKLTNTTVALQSLDDDELTKFNLGSQAGEVNIINESGLYALILRSRKPEAKRFRKWVTNEVLPAIRKTGAYAIQKKPEDIIREVVGHHRFMLWFDHNGYIGVKLIEPDAFVGNTKRFIEYISDPECFESESNLCDLATACISRLHSRVTHAKASIKAMTEKIRESQELIGKGGLK